MNLAAYLDRNDHNIIAVDWSFVANLWYPIATLKVKSVGRVLATAIDEMIDEGLPLNSLHIIGHSMGAHVAGFIGRLTTSKLPRITGNFTSGITVQIYLFIKY